MTNAELARQLASLRLPRTAADLEDFIARATKGRWSPTVLLEELVRHELLEREHRSLERRLRAAHLGRFKPIDEFDWNWPAKIDRRVIDRALSGELVRERENLVLVAAQGLGKTMLARNIAHAAVLRGYSALFTEASKMFCSIWVPRTPLARSSAACVTTPDPCCFASTRSATCPTTLAPRICCSRSSAAATSNARS
jgi:DNA replication protein DnaC